MHEKQELIGGVDNRYFKVYPFMYELGLGSAARMVYAVIYAFRDGEGSGFWGTAEYLATAAGVSRRTVYRILKDLLERGRIEVLETRRGRTYRATDRRDPDQRAREHRPPSEKVAYTLRDPVDGLIARQVTHEEALGLLELRAEEYDTESSVDRALVELTVPPRPPKYREVELERFDCVSLTVGQYRRLRELVTEETLNCHLWQLNELLHKCYDRQEPGPKNHYRTLLRWIEEKNGV